jgi:hypothetical protein
MIGGGVIELMALTATAICVVDFIAACGHLVHRRMQEPACTDKLAKAPKLPIDDVAPKVSGKAMDAMCPICLEDLKDLAEVGARKTRCGHAFCAPCFESWYARAPRCPLCNEDFRASSAPTFIY